MVSTCREFCKFFFQEKKNGENGKIAIEKTIGDETHTYGVKFEQAIPKISDLLKTY